MKKTILSLIVSLLFLSSPFPSHATSLKPLSLDQITELSELVFRGTVQEVIIRMDPYESGMMAKYVTFQIEDCLKGECHDPTVIIKEADAIKAVPNLVEGETYLIFLSAESEQTGFTAPVGLDKGQYKIQDLDGKKIVRGLSRTVSTVKTPHALALQKGLKLPSLQNENPSYTEVKALIQSFLE